jgi:hypothetical protein
MRRYREAPEKSGRGRRRPRRGKESGEHLGRYWTDALEDVQGDPCRHKEIWDGRSEGDTVDLRQIQEDPEEKLGDPTI